MAAFELRCDYAERAGPRAMKEPWLERYRKEAVTTLAEAEAAAKSLIGGYNDTLRPGETARKLVSVRLLSDEEVEQIEMAGGHVQSLDPKPIREAWDDGEDEDDDDLFADEDEDDF